MAGEANRKIFFTDHNLGLSEGYKLFLSGIPKLEDVNPNHNSDTSDLKKRLLLLFRKERINEGAVTVDVSAILILTFAPVFPILFEDVNRRMKDWGNEGRMDPFNEVYDVSL